MKPKNKSPIIRGIFVLALNYIDWFYFLTFLKFTTEKLDSCGEPIEVEEKSEEQLRKEAELEGKVFLNNSL